MSKPRKKDNLLGECAYCPAPATTKDHIPPKGMFAKGTPNKPWVPACGACNGGASLDDEYMQRLSMLWGADACKDAIEVGEKFMRSLERPEAQGLQAEVRRSLSPMEDESLFPGGINMALQGDRLGHVTDKLVRGWWFKFTAERVPEGYEIMKYLPGGRRDNPLYEANEKLIETCPGYSVGDMAFVVRFAYCPNSLLTCWLFEFYKVFKIMAYTCKMGEDHFQILDLRKPFAVVNFDD
ncbi:MAG TPA: hypothetical protein VMY37_13600 [Thermoguttaceae bacterium]|nr:hypothetical protein [Thermoguttaceae bacterium]